MTKRATRSGSPTQLPIQRRQRSSESLRQRHIPGIVSCDSPAQLPNPRSHRLIGQERNTQLKQVRFAIAPRPAGIAFGRTARRRMFATSAGNKCGAARAPLSSSDSAHKPSEPESTSAATTTDAPRRASSAIVVSITQYFTRGELAAGARFARAHLCHERANVRTAG